MFSKIHVFVHDGLYSVHSGGGTANYRFLASLLRLGYGKDLVVSPVWTPSWSSDFDQTWFRRCKRLLKESGAQIMPIENGSDGRDRYGWVENWRISSRRAFELVQGTAEIGKQTLVLSFDSPFMDLIPLLADMPGAVHVLVPRGMGLQHTPDSLDRLEYERQAFRHADCQNTWVGTISSYMEEHLRTDYGVRDEKLIPIRCGVLLDEHEPVPQAEIDRTLKESHTRVFILFSTRSC